MFTFIDKIKIELESIRLIQNLYNLVQIAKDNPSFANELSINIDHKLINNLRYRFQILGNAIRLNQDDKNLSNIWESNEFCILRSS